MDLLRHLFSHFCGQVNCWHAAGVTSVACQRCTGLYLGALIGTVLFSIFRPRPTSLSLWLHGIAMLVIIPFGYHLVPHRALVRAVTGQLFGYGMAYYLLLVPADRFDLWRPRLPYPCRPLLARGWGSLSVPHPSRIASFDARGWGSFLYLISLFIAIPLVLSAATSASAVAIVTLSYLAFAGLLTVLYLVGWNALILASMAWVRLRARISVAA